MKTDVLCPRPCVILLCICLMCFGWAGELSAASPPSYHVTLAWDPNMESDIAGYRLYYGPASGHYTNTIEVGNVTNATVNGLLPGSTYYFAVTVYNISDMESGFSNEVSYSVPLNTAPSFVRGPDVTIAEGSGAQTFSHWATGITPGPAADAGQTVQFVVNNDLNDLFAIPPAIDPAGTLTFTPAPNQRGSARITVWLQDNGGKVNGGQDTTPPTTFTLTVGDPTDADANGIPDDHEALFPTPAITNAPPAISDITDQTTTVDGTIMISFNISDDKTPANLLRLNAMSSRPTLVPENQIFFGGTGQDRKLYLIPTPDQEGETTITITIADGENATVSDSFVLTVGTPPPRLKADFNRDGQDDLLFQNDDGTIAVWYLNGLEITQEICFNPCHPENGSRLISSADFNRDDNADLLFQNTDGSLIIWLLQGVHLQASPSIIRWSPATGWAAVATGDFNHDSTSDIVFQHSDGTLAVWFMDGPHFLKADLINPASQADPRLRVVGAGDMNGDRHVDLIFQNRDSQELSVWFMDGINGTSAGLLTPDSPPYPDLKVVAVADFNADRKVDLLFYNGSVLATWMMDGASRISSAFLTTPNIEPSWNVVGPR